MTDTIDDLDGCTGPELEQIARQQRAEITRLRDLLDDLRALLEHAPEELRRRYAHALDER